MPHPVDSNLKPATTSPLNNFAKVNLDSGISRKIYKDGHAVKVVYNETKGIYGNLNFPSAPGGGLGCLWSPVKFLKDFKVKCPKRLTRKICAKNTMLDYQMYLLPLPKGTVLPDGANLAIFSLPVAIRILLGDWRLFGDFWGLGIL